MLQKKYFDFKENLNENVQQAKVYLKNLALKKKKEAAGETEGPVGLSADEVRAAETNPNFVKIKDMCRENPGYTYLFTKIFFDEYKEDTEKFIDLQNLYNEIKGLGNLIKEVIEDSPEEFKNQINRLLTDENLYQSIKTNARNFILKNFNWTENIDKINLLLSN